MLRCTIDSEKNFFYVIQCKQHTMVHRRRRVVGYLWSDKVGEGLHKFALAHSGKRSEKQADRIDMGCVLRGTSGDSDVGASLQIVKAVMTTLGQLDAARKGSGAPAGAAEFELMRRFGRLSYAFSLPRKSFRKGFERR